MPEGDFMNKTFYYNFKPLNAFLLFNIVITALVGSCFMCGWQILYWPQMWVLIGTVLFSWGVWYYKYIHPQVMAVVTDQSIKIDHTHPLKWQDISYAEIKDVPCCFKKYRVLSLVPKENVDYKYLWLQKHNSFPPFSIPLYGLMTKDDEDKISEIVAKKVTVKQ